MTTLYGALVESNDDSYKNYTLYKIYHNIQKRKVDQTESTFPYFYACNKQKVPRQEKP